MIRGLSTLCLALCCCLVGILGEVIDALTTGEELETGAPIRVVEVINDSTLLVERF